MEQTEKKNPILTLGRTFADSQVLFQSIENSSLRPDDPIYQSEVQNALGLFLRISNGVQSASMFSSNEELDDISSGSLKYLLVEYYIAQLLEKIVDVDSSTRDVSRIRNLKLATDRYWAFLNKCESIKLVHKQDLESFHREGSVNATIKREEKVARFKREQEAQNRLKETIKKRGKNGFIGNETEDEEEDDDTLREFSLLLLDIAIRKSVENYISAKEEADMLEQVIKMKEKSGGKLPPPPEKPPQFQNFVLLPSKREQLKKEVFRPSYPLPTMTVEEWAEEQMRLGLMPSPGDVPTTQKKKEEDNEEEEEKATLKARAWDDWKDDHPRGVGNKNDNYFKRG